MEILPTFKTFKCIYIFSHNLVNFKMKVIFAILNFDILMKTLFYFNRKAVTNVCDNNNVTSLPNFVLFDLKFCKWLKTQFI